MTSIPKSMTWTLKVVAIRNLFLISCVFAVVLLVSADSAHNVESSSVVVEHENPVKMGVGLRGLEADESKQLNEANVDDPVSRLLRKKGRHRHSHYSKSSPHGSYGKGKYGRFLQPYYGGRYGYNQNYYGGSGWGGYPSYGYNRPNYGSYYGFGGRPGYGYYGGGYRYLSEKTQEGTSPESVESDAGAQPRKLQFGGYGGLGGFGGYGGFGLGGGYGGNYGGYGGNYGGYGGNNGGGYGGNYGGGYGGNYGGYGGNYGGYGGRGHHHHHH